MYKIIEHIAYIAAITSIIVRGIKAFISPDVVNFFRDNKVENKDINDIGRYNVLIGYTHIFFACSFIFKYVLETMFDNMTLSIVSLITMAVALLITVLANKLILRKHRIIENSNN